MFEALKQANIWHSRGLKNLFSPKNGVNFVFLKFALIIANSYHYVSHDL